MSSASYPPNTPMNTIYCSCCSVQLSYPQGSMYIQCPKCRNTMNPQAPQQTSCINCSTLLAHPPNSLYIQCPKCLVTMNAREVPRNLYQQQMMQQYPMQTKPAKKRKDPNAPKAASNAYMIFCKERRAKLKEEFPELPFGQLGAKLGQMWRALTADEKKPYEDKASEDRERYRKDMENYQNGLGDQSVGGEMLVLKKSRVENGTSSSSSLLHHDNGSVLLNTPPDGSGGIEQQHANVQGRGTPNNQNPHLINVDYTISSLDTMHGFNSTNSLAPMTDIHKTAGPSTEPFGSSANLESPVTGSGVPMSSPPVETSLPTTVVSPVDPIQQQQVQPQSQQSQPQHQLQPSSAVGVQQEPSALVDTQSPIPTPTTSVDVSKSMDTSEGNQFLSNEYEQSSNEISTQQLLIHQQTVPKTGEVPEQQQNSSVKMEGHSSTSTNSEILHTTETSTISNPNSEANVGVGVSMDTQNDTQSNASATETKPTDKSGDSTDMTTADSFSSSMLSED